LTPARALAPETIVQAKYRILREIGRGGMGIVYEAEDIRLNRTVALKFLPAELTRDPKARERFVQEARAASALDHPNICTIHEIDETEGGDMFIAMACYGGESLEQKIVDGPIAATDVIGYSAQIAEGLAKAHERGIIHRDVKPGNILITSDGTVKIVDFGLAKLAGQVRRTLPGTTLGTVAYMSPEQARGESADVRTDVWSLGVVLYEMATGELPFRGENGQAVLYSILNKPPKPVQELRPGFPTELETIIRKALNKDPAKRFTSAQEMAEALSDLKFRMTAREYAAAKRLSFRRPGRRWLIGAASAVTVSDVPTTVTVTPDSAAPFDVPNVETTAIAPGACTVPLIVAVKPDDGVAGAGAPADGDVGEPPLPPHAVRAAVSKTSGISRRMGLLRHALAGHRNEGQRRCRAARRPVGKATY